MIKNYDKKGQQKQSINKSVNEYHYELFANEILLLIQSDWDLLFFS